MSRILRRVRQAGVYFVTSHTWQRRALFSKPDPARILLEQIVECRARQFYGLHAFVIMPDHFHALLTPGPETTLEKAMQMIKGGSAHRIRKELLYTFPVWQPGYHDRWIRNSEEYAVRKLYIEQNPVKARLVEKGQDYSLGSAGGSFALDSCAFEEELQGLKPLS